MSGYFTVRLLRLALAGLSLSGLYACSEQANESVERSDQALDGQNGISAVLRVASSWENGSCSDVTIRNSHPTAATTTWKVTLDLRSATLSSGWNASYTGNSGRVDFSNLGWNGSILAGGGSVTFGICTNRSGAEAPIVLAVTSDLPGGSGGTGGSSGTGGSGGVGGSTGGTGGSTGGSAGSNGGTGGTTSGVRNLPAYGTDTVFLVSDADYRAVMSLVPVTTWRASKDDDYTGCQHPYGGADKSCAYPTLVYHEENGVADIDPVFHFLEQSGAKKILHASTLPTAARDALAAKFTLTALGNRKNYWKSTSKVVRVPADYAQSLVAATYAALIDVPLVIEGYDTVSNYGTPSTICVGTLPGTCTETINVATAQKRIQTLTNSKRLVLTSSVDLTSHRTQAAIALERTPGSFAQLYGKLSLGAPFLAVAKAQIPLVFTTANPTPSTIDTFIGQQLTALGLAAPEYLTIIASPHTIPQARFGSPVRRDGSASQVWSQVDSGLYGDLDGDWYQELKVGRIFSQSVSGVSANIARSLFHHRMAKSNAFATLTSFTEYFSFNHSAYLARALSGLGYTNQSASSDSVTPFPVDSLRNKMLLFYEGHGFSRGGNGGFTTDTLRAQRIWLPSTLGVSMGCSTCSFDRGEQEGLFCAELVRRGAIAFYGTVDDTSDNNRGPAHFMQRLIKGDDLGTAFRHGMNRGFADGVLAFSPFDVLMGDPTFKPGFTGTLEQDTIHVTAGNLTNTGNGYVVPVDIRLEPVTTTSKLHNRFSWNLSHDIVEAPFYAGDSSFQNMLANIHQYSEPPATGVDNTFVADNITVIASFANPERRQPREYRYVERRIGAGAAQVITSDFTTFPPHAVTNSAGVTFVQLSVRPENNLIGPNTTSIPEVKFHFDLVFE